MHISSFLAKELFIKLKVSNFFAAQTTKNCYYLHCKVTNNQNKSRGFQTGGGYLLLCTKFFDDFAPQKHQNKPMKSHF